MEVEQVLLAIMTGFGFGVIAWRIGSTAGRLAVFLALLAIMQTFSQVAWRILDGRGTIDELLIVAESRIIFGVAAVGILWFLNRRRT